MEDEENNKYVVLVKEEKQLKCREHKRDEGNLKKKLSLVAERATVV